MQNFKRFTDFLVTDIPESARIVVVVGPNGCGKSSLFDGLLEWDRHRALKGSLPDDAYFVKDQDIARTPEDVDVDVHGDANFPPNQIAVYVRTAHRNDADFSFSSIDRPSDPADEVYRRRLIDDDKGVFANYNRLLIRSISELHDPNNADVRAGLISEAVIGDIRSSLLRVFPDLHLHNLVDPFSESGGSSGTLFFRKGTVASYHFKNLSGGEKVAFDILLDIHLKRSVYPQLVYCIDEVEAHLHTAVQGALVKELGRVIPEDGQLWITTHSLGVLRAVQAIETATPGSTCTIDFSGIDADAVEVLSPSGINRVTWDKMLSMALDDMAGRLSPEFIVICEGSASGSRRRNFDAEICETVLGSRNPQVQFVSGGSSSEVPEAGDRLRPIIHAVTPGVRVFTLVDRDEMSDEDVRRRNPDDLVLSERNVESYLLSDDVISALLEREGKSHLREEAIKIKQAAVSASVKRGNPPDDLKSAAGDIHNGLKDLLDLRRTGGADSFMRDQLAPLIVPGLDTYDRLTADIIDKLQ